MQGIGFGGIHEVFQGQPVFDHPSIDLCDGGSFFALHIAFGRGKEGAGFADQIVKTLVVQGFAAGGRHRAPARRAI